MFSDWIVYLKNVKNFSVKLEKDVKKMHDYDDQDEIYYKPMQFMSHNIRILENIKFNKVYLESTVSIYFYLKVQYL